MSDFCSYCYSKPEKVWYCQCVPSVTTGSIVVAIVKWQIGRAVTSSGATKLARSDTIMRYVNLMARVLVCLL